MCRVVSVLVIGWLLSGSCLEAYAEGTQTSGQESAEVLSTKAEKSSASDVESGTDSVEHSQLPLYSAPNYNRLLPIRGWTRFAGDAARTLGEWHRWWTYLMNKTPVLMQWMDGLVLKIYPKNEVSRALFVKGIYEPNLVVVAKAVMPSGGVLLDAGASIGYLPLLMSKLAGENGRIYAIEPSERDFNRLEENVKLNHLVNVGCYRLAVSDKSGKVELSVASEERNRLNTLAMEFRDKGVERLKKEVVDAVTIDEFVKQNNIAHVDVLKLDIEGSEVKALKGAKDTIETFRPVIILGSDENMLKACGDSIGEMASLLTDRRYRCYDLIDTPFFALKEIPDLRKTRSKVVICFHETVVPPTLPQPQEKSFGDSVTEFFTK